MAHLSQNNQPSGREPNLGHADYEARVLSALTRRSVRLGPKPSVYICQ
jgi:hypothetical protein